jgi:nucleoside-diphosphate-sugar epimerase
MPDLEEAGSGLLSQRFLAADGYAAGQAETGRSLGQREGSLEDVVNPWQGRRIFLTGHTGFKGGWLSLWLAVLGAQIRGYALDPSTEPNLFNAASVASILDDVRGDVRSYEKLEAAMTEFAPEVVFHLAAQPLVRRSYADPLGRIATQCANLWGDTMSWISDSTAELHEAHSLRLDASRAREELGWRARLSIESALEWTLGWYRCAQQGADVQQETLAQIARFEKEQKGDIVGS